MRGWKEFKEILDCLRKGEEGGERERVREVCVYVIIIVIINSQYIFVVFQVLVGQRVSYVISLYYVEKVGEVEV